MKTTLYEALGIAQTASDEEVRTALRRLIRKYYARTRDGHGNVEEALRFINHASRILGDPERRVRYDQEIALSGGTTEQKIAHVVAGAIVESGAHTDVDIAAVSEAKNADEALETGLDTPEAAPRPFHHPGLTERVSSFSRSTVITVGLCVLFGGIIAAAILFVTPADAVFVAKQVLVWLTLTLVLLTAVYGVVHGIGWVRGRGRPLASTLAPRTDLAILNWRREKSVFLGTNQPEEDASWIFQLRMAELERAKAGRTSEPRPWNRLAARLFDYAIWGLVLALLLSELRAVDLVTERLGYWLSHPLVAPIVITLTWVPVEALLVASLATTPGKWLFGCYVQFSISDAYAERGTRAQLARGLRRAFRVWWQGMSCGIVVVAPILIAFAYERLMQQQETAWDFAQDCLVTHGPPGMLNVATGACGLAAMLWLYGVAWHKPMTDTIAWAQSAVVASLPPAQSLIPRGFFGGAGPIGGLVGSAPPAPPAPSPPNTGAPTPSPALAAESGPSDPEIAAQFAERRARVAVLSVEGPRMLRAGSFRRAAELCRTWTELELGNAQAWRCLGDAQQALGNHRDAVSAFRKAKQYDPTDRTIDAAIERAQQGIVADFLNRYRP